MVKVELAATLAFKPSMATNASSGGEQLSMTMSAISGKAFPDECFRIIDFAIGDGGNRNDGHANFFGNQSHLDRGSVVAAVGENDDGITHIQIVRGRTFLISPLHAPARAIRALRQVR